MTMQEFGVACEYKANLIVLISNNGMYGAIRLHQQKNSPKRPSGTSIFNPDYAAIARSYGAFGAVAKTNAEFEAVFAQARAADRPAILEMHIDSNALSPMAKLEKLGD